MSLLTKENLIAIFPLGRKHIDAFYAPLCKEMDYFDIASPIRIAAFLAQIGHESGQLKYVEEIASGRAYERRMDLGNSNPGDGVKYKGRGLIQITGKNNYIAVKMSLGIDCVDHPELLQTTENAVKTACWFWQKNGLNALADNLQFDKITRKINGGYNGAEDRNALFANARRVLKC